MARRLRPPTGRGLVPLRLREVPQVPGRVEDDVIEIEPIFTTRDGRLSRAQGTPPRRERFARVGIDPSRLLGDL